MIIVNLTLLETHKVMRLREAFVVALNEMLEDLEVRVEMSDVDRERAVRLAETVEEILHG